MRISKKPTITVGIISYNDEGTIAELLRQLLNQNLPSAVLSKIIVFSNGSTDRTVFAAQQVKSKRIVVINRKHTIHTNKVLNLLFHYAVSDLFVLLSGEVLLTEATVVEELIKPFLVDASTGLVNGAVELSGKNSLESRVAMARQLLRNQIISRFKSGVHLYASQGRIQALSHKFYRNVRLPSHVSPEVFMYLSCRERGLHFAYASKARVLGFKTLSIVDYLKQKSQFDRAIQILSRHFSFSLLKKEFTSVPARVMWRACLSQLARNPVLMLLVTAIELYSHISTTQMSLPTIEIRTPTTTKILVSSRW